MTDRPSDTIPIRDAACIVLCDQSEAETRLLLGKRRDTQVFLPNKWVFPGGRVDDEDRRLVAGIAVQNLSPSATARLPFIAAALRELNEEAGLTLNFAGQGNDYNPAAINWACTMLIPVARAITPPGRPRRFDTWFFLADRTHANASTEPDGELLELGWFTLTQTRQLDLPIITRHVVEDVAACLRRGTDAARRGPFPFYFQGAERYERQLISDDYATTPP